MKIIITGASGMVGEGVLLECLANPLVSNVMVIGRRSCGHSHPKMKELMLSDFDQISSHTEKVKEYDGCFFSAGVSSVGMNEENYARITYTTTMNFAKVLSEANSNMVFDYVTGTGTDSTEKGRLMWARVKGKTENDLIKLPFRGQYNFRPGVMTPVKAQKNVKTFYKPFLWILPLFMGRSVLSLNEVGKAMINSVRVGYSKQVLEIKDIRKLSEM